MRNISMELKVVKVHLLFHRVASVVSPVVRLW